MTLKECYEAIGGNYEEVIGRLRSERLVQKFTLKFLDDKSLELLEKSLKEENYEEAFRAAHSSLFFFKLKIRAMTAATHCPATVAMAAPATSMRGKPK